MAKKIHVTKTEELQDESAIQIRDDNPALPVDGQVWWNDSEGKLSIQDGGTEKVVNLRVLAADPAVPVEGEAWINDTAMALKWHFGAVTQTINLAPGAVVQESDTKGGYLSVLDDAELKVISDVSSGFPDYIIESFQDEKDSVTLTGVEIESNRLSLPDGTSIGTYERSQRTSTRVNNAEGVMVATLQGLAPKLITDNLDGTHSLKFHGDVSGYFANAKDVFAFEIDTINGIKKSIYLLDAQDKPALLNTNGPATYNGGLDETDVTLDDAGLDLSLGIPAIDQYEKVRFAPFGMKVEAGGDGLGGALVELPIEEAHSIEARRVLGKPNLHVIEKTLGGSVNNIAIKRSPNKQNYLILAQVERLANSNTVLAWYSTDGLATLNQATNFNSPCVASGGSEGEGGSNRFMDRFATMMFNSATMRVMDDGNFIFSHYFYSINGYYHNKLYYGNMTGPTFDYRLITSRPNTAASVGGSTSIGATNHIYGLDIDFDEASGTLASFMTDQSQNAYCLFFHIDFATLTSESLNYFYHGGSYWAHAYKGHCFWVDMEGERMLLMVSTHSNSYTYGTKVTLDEVQTASFDSQIAVSSQGAFTTSVDNGTRYETSAFVHQLTTTGRLVSVYNDEASGNIFFYYEDSSPNEGWLVVLNTGRTQAGINSSVTYTFDAVADSGTVGVTIFDDGVNAGGTIFNYNDSAATIETTLETLYPGLGDITVTGDFQNGITIDFNVFGAHDITITANNLLIGAVPVVETRDGGSVVGQRARHLFWNSANTSYRYNEWSSLIPITKNCITDWSYMYGSSIASGYAGNRYAETTMHVEGDTVIIAFDGIEASNDYDYAKSTIIKIPNYKETFGLHTLSSPGSLANLYLGNTATSVAYGDRFAQIITVPVQPNFYQANRGLFSAFYSDGLVPFRTIDIYAGKTYTGVASFQESQRVTAKLVGVSGGVPDEGNVIAVAVHDRKLKDFPQYDDYKWMTFNFDDVRLAPGSQVCLIIEPNYVPTSPAYLDPTGRGDRSGQLKLGGRSIASSDFFREVGGVWENQNYEMWYRVYDTYQIDSHMAQNNDDWIGPSSQINFYNRMDSESTISKTALNEYMLTYKNHAFNKSDSLEYTSDGCSKTYHGKIDDTGGQYAMPVFESPKRVAQQDSLSDINMAFCMNLGTIESKKIDPRTGETTLPDNVTEQFFNYRAPQGGQISTVAGGLGTEASLGGTVYGNKDDSDFDRGRACHFRAQGIINFDYNAYSGRIGCEDFCVEVEIKPDPEDLNSSGHVIFERYGEFSIRTYQGKYYCLLFENVSNAGHWFQSSEDVIDGYHRFRFGRDNNGPFMEYSTDGVVWTTLNIALGNGDLSRYSKGVPIGYNATGYGYYAIGRYINSASSYWYGKIGYIKFIVGSRDFAYDGAADYDNQFGLVEVYNLGDKFISMKLKHDTGNDNKDQNVADIIVSYPEQITSIVETQDQMFKLKDVITTGRDLAVKVTLEKNSDDDPACIQGILLNYEKK